MGLSASRLSKLNDINQLAKTIGFWMRIYEALGNVF